ncbi:IPT/TIG domain-containing protein [Desulfonema magnum]|uniref:Immunoglobulin-like fold-containing protein n=1 Tax=Desulfonema magnum TaxID=45655 RepID=A0A975BVI4_9BACT|nr:IPT/TIG domain-containing protein [Desulfonema magnum]QTA92267.1 Immunoglobulin-like fold-containing protein [Desulfonema magnum]
MIRKDLTVLVLVFLLVFGGGVLLNAHAAISSDEREALVEIYNSTGGSNWTNTTQGQDVWDIVNLSSNCCGWYGITCDVFKTKVTKIKLSKNNLTGSIPSSISKLINLTEMDLSENTDLTSIPAEIGELPNLTKLDLSKNTGLTSIPLTLGNIADLSLSDCPSLSVSAPDNITVAAKADSITLEWPGDSYDNITYQYFNNGEDVCQDDINITPIADKIQTKISGLTQGTEYSFTVRTVLTADVDLISDDSNTVDVITEGIVPDEREALEALYTSTGGGTEWTDWDIDKAGGECDGGWQGISCIEDDNKKHVVEINLNGSGLNGTIPGTDVINKFEKLQRLDLSENPDISGSIPSGTWNLQKLLTLNLSGCGLTGDIPPELGNLESLTELYLNNNQLGDNDSGIPPDLGNLPNLQKLNLSNNQLTGDIPSDLGNLSSLTELYLNDNRLTGGIPKEFETLSNLDILNVASNKLTEEISSDLSVLDLNATESNIRWNALYKLDDSLDGWIASNFKYGDQWRNYQSFAPQELRANESGALTEPYKITLKWNKIPFDGSGGGKYEIEYTNPADTSWYKETTDLNTVSLPLTGTDGLEACTEYSFRIRTIANSHPSNSNLIESEYTKVVTFSTSCIPLDERNALINLFNSTGKSDQIAGELGDPGEECNWPGVTCDNNDGEAGKENHVTEIDLSSQTLSGSIPATSIGNFSELTKLNLSDNKNLTGGIPSELNQLSELTELRLNDCGLTGKIPVELGSGILARDVFIDQEAGEGGFLLYLSNNELTGKIPPELEKITRLTELKLDNNHMEGTIPAELGDLPALRVIWVNGNMLEGPVPSDLQRLQDSLAKTPSSDFRFNKLYTNIGDGGTHNFLTSQQIGGNWENTQTVAPVDANFFVDETKTTSTSISLAWDAIKYDFGNGGYEVYYSTSELGGYKLYDPQNPDFPRFSEDSPFPATESLQEERITVKGLTPDTAYWFYLQAVSFYKRYDGDEGNTLISKPTKKVSASTTKPVPIVIRVEKDNGPACGGEAVTIIGENLSNVVEVRFGSTKATGNFITSETKIEEVITPAHSAGEVYVRAMDEDSQGEPCPTECYTYNPPPIASSIEPNFGPASLGKNVKITGSNFVSGATVVFGENDPVRSSGSGGIITCTAPVNIACDDPSKPACKVKVIVTNPDKQTSEALSFTYNPPPKIKSITRVLTPGDDCAGAGDKVEITGKYFDIKDNTSVLFGISPVQKIISKSATLITCQIPSNAPGEVDVKVTNEDGQYDDSGYFQYDCPIDCSVTGIDPSNGPATGGTTVIITGTGFNGSTVSFGGTKIEHIKYILESRIIKGIECETPAHAAGKVNVVVSNAGGDCTPVTTYTYDSPPSINEKGVQPDSGYEFGGDDVTITGENFVDGATVTFGGISATVVQVLSSTKITCKNPPNDNGSAKVVVTNPDGQSCEDGDTCGQFYYMANPKPEIISFDPEESSMFGGVFLTITGRNFFEGATVTFGGEKATNVNPVSETTITCLTPLCKGCDPNDADGKIDVDVEVKNTDGQFDTEPYPFIVIPLRLTPAQGPAYGGTTVTIRPGDDSVSFLKSGTTTVTFDGVSASDISVYPDKIICTTLAVLEPGLADVVVNNSSQSFTCSECYKYTGIPDTERQALIDLYTKTNGGGWTDTTGWLGNEYTECTWKGVFCDAGQEHVEKLILDNNNLVGTFPESISDLSSLQVISIKNNKMRTPIPETILDLNLKDGQSDFSWNYLCTEDGDAITDFLKQKQVGSEDFRYFQQKEDGSFCKLPETSLIVMPASLNVDESQYAEIPEDENELDTLFSSFTVTPAPGLEYKNDVTIKLYSSNVSECNVYPASVTLNSENWNDGAKAYVIPEKDGIPDGLQTCTILTAPAISSDGNFNNENPEDVTVFVSDSDQGLTLTQVYPNLGVINQELSATLRGTGFDKSSTKVYIFKDKDDSNKTEITQISSVSSTEIALTIPAQTEKGQYTLKVSDDEKNENDVLEGAISIKASQDEVDEQEKKKAIIVAGGGSYSGNVLWTATKNCANRAYLVLMSQGYSHDSINYLNPEKYIDVDGDGVSDVDEELTQKNLENAIKEWAKTSEPLADELLIYMTGHGGNGRFELREGETIEATVLNGWLNDLQTEMPGKLIFVYDACVSGSFISRLTPEAGKERYVIASASADERAWFLDDGEFSFSYHFWDAVENKGRLYSSFVDGKDMMVGQTSLIDIDGDGEINVITNDKGELIISDNIIIGRGRVAASGGQRPQIVSLLADKEVLSCSETSSGIRANVAKSLNDIFVVWGKIIPPYFSENLSEEELKKEVTHLPSIKLTLGDDSDNYEGIYEDFSKPGTYKVAVYAIDTGLYESIPKDTKIVRNYCKGDFDGNGTVELADAIILLRMAAGADVSDQSLINNNGTDADGDGKIGLADAVYILKKLAGEM